MEPVSAENFDSVTKRLMRGFDVVSRYRLVPIDDLADILVSAKELGIPANEIKDFVYKGHAYPGRPDLANEAIG